MAKFYANVYSVDEFKAILQKIKTIIHEQQQSVSIKFLCMQGHYSTAHFKYTYFSQELINTFRTNG